MSLPKNLITIYGRNPVLEALNNSDLKIYALHLSKSNKPSSKLEDIIKLAKRRDIKIKYHDKRALSFISKNSKQDQGVALDIVLDNLYSIDYLEKLDSFRVLALDSIENPQNLGMIIRSAAAGDIDAVILQKRGTASLISPLVIKASVGTAFKIPIIYVKSLKDTLFKIKSISEIISLDLSAKESLFDIKIPNRAIFVLGNESRGVSKEIDAISTLKVKIPMNRGVESLNVAVTASIISFLLK